MRKHINNFPHGVINYSRFKVMEGAGTFAINCKNSSFSVVFIVESDYKARRRKSDSCGQSDREIIGHRVGQAQRLDKPSRGLP